MKIQFDFMITEDDIEVLHEEFKSIEYVHKDEEYEQVEIDTNDIKVEFVDFIQKWLDAGYVTKYDRVRMKYIISL